jgi:hypothetical protein
MTFAIRALLVPLLFVGLCGCGGSAPEGDATSPSTDSSSSTGAKKYEKGALPAVGEYLPPLDVARVEVAPPKTWRILPNNRNYVCAFAKEAGGGLPRIIVKAEDATFESFPSVTAENVADFATAVEATVQDVVEKPKPLILGENAFARFVKEAAFKNAKAEVQVLMTQHAERLYTIELQVIAGAITVDRDQAYAVAANMKFLEQPGQTPDPAPQPAEDPAAEAATAEKSE